MPTTRGQKRDAEMEAALKLFFSSPRFAVAGASSDPNKFGHRSTLDNLNYILTTTNLIIHSCTYMLSIRLVSPALPSRYTSKPTLPQHHRAKSTTHHRPFPDCSPRSPGV